MYVLMYVVDFPKATVSESSSAVTDGTVADDSFVEPSIVDDLAAAVMQPSTNNFLRHKKKEKKKH